MKLDGWWVVIILWILTGVYDIILVSKGEKAISYRSEALLPRGWDVAIVVTALTCSWAFAQKLFPTVNDAGPKVFCLCLTFAMLSHMLLGHERYKK